MNIDIIYNLVFPITAFGGFVTAISWYVKYKNILNQHNEKDRVIERQMHDQERILEMINEISRNVLLTFDRLSLDFNNELKEIKLNLQKTQLQVETIREDITILKNHSRYGS
jgi:F0F1-type ATP synthase membrane subunit b/b'